MQTPQAWLPATDSRLLQLMPAFCPWHIRDAAWHGVLQCQTEKMPLAQNPSPSSASCIPIQSPMPAWKSPGGSGALSDARRSTRDHSCRNGWRGRTRRSTLSMLSAMPDSSLHSTAKQGRGATQCGADHWWQPCGRIVAAAVQHVLVSSHGIMKRTARHGTARRSMGSTHSMTSQGSSLRASRSATAGAGPSAASPWEELPAAPAAPSASAGWYTSLRAHTAASARLPPRACAMSSRTLQQATPPHRQWWSGESGAQPGNPPGPAAVCSRSQPLALARKRSSACPATCDGRKPSSKRWKEAGDVWRESGGGGGCQLLQQ